jgi:hypothetical protein
VRLEPFLHAGFGSVPRKVTSCLQRLHIHMRNLALSICLQPQPFFSRFATASFKHYYHGQAYVSVAREIIEGFDEALIGILKDQKLYRAVDCMTRGVATCSWQSDLCPAEQRLYKLPLLSVSRVFLLPSYKVFRCSYAYHQFALRSILFAISDTLNISVGIGTINYGSCRKLFTPPCQTRL